MNDEEHAIKFHSGKWKVCTGAIVVASGHKTGTLYMTTNVRDTVDIAYVSVDSNLWHLRLGHISEKGMRNYQN